MKSIFDLSKRTDTPLHIVVEFSKRDLKVVVESLTKRIKDIAYRVEGPHFPGDEKHTHAYLPHGYEVTYNQSGSRRHPNKFPLEVPKAIKQNIAKMLKIPVDVLGESYGVSPLTDDPYVLIEANEINPTQRILMRFQAMEDRESD